MIKKKNLSVMDYIRPTAEEITKAIEHPELWNEEGLKQKPIIDSSKWTEENMKEEWEKDHSAYFIAYVLPTLDMALDIRRVAIEAYLTYRIVDGKRISFEQECDGSSVVPDNKRYGYTKDWQGVLHDFLFEMHHRGWADAFEKVWGYWASNDAYRRAWLTDNSYFRSVVWFAGLTVGSWPVWYGWWKV
jgi:hypothetical protein